MSIRGDSYGSVAEVLAYTRHLLDDESSFNTTTRPTLTEVEKFIDRASGALNVALRGCGLTVPITNSTAKLPCDDWVVNQAAGYVELTQRGAGFDWTESTRAGAFFNLNESASEWVSESCSGLKKLVGSGGVTDKYSDGLQFTGLKVKADRDDPDDTTLRQPVFERGQFDDKSTSKYQDDATDDY